MSAHSHPKSLSAAKPANSDVTESEPGLHVNMTNYLQH